MARLAAIEKAMFFATPNRVMEMLAKKLPIYSYNQVVALDPCCGEGTALSILLSRFEHKTSYGVEIHSERAKKAKTVLKHVLEGSAFNLHTKDGFVNLCLLNPPYNDDELGGRQELQFLELATPWLMPRGALVFIPPRHLMAREDVRLFLYTHYEVERVWDFPLPERNDFDQVIIFARKRAYPAKAIKGSAPEYIAYESLDEAPDKVNQGVYFYPKYDELLPATPIKDPIFTIVDFDPKKWENQALPCTKLPAWNRLLGDRGRASHEPLSAPRPGHQAMLLAAGQLNGADLGGFLIKGSSEKTRTVIVDEQRENTIERERIVSRISTLDTKTGEFDTWLVHEDLPRTEQWFKQHGEQLARVVTEMHNPVFKGDTSPYRTELDKLHAPGKLMGVAKQKLLPLQEESACAIAFRWKTQKTVALSGEMGVGKTVTAIAACELAKAKKVVVLCPTHLVKKWIRECERVTKIDGIAMTAKTLSEVREFFESDATYLILSKETAKLGSRWRHAGIVKNLYCKGMDDHLRLYNKVVRCPKCGDTVTDTGNEFQFSSFLQEKKQLSCQKPTKFSEDGKKVLKRCGEPLWQTIPLSDRGTKRWPLAKYINKRYGYRYTLIVDEAHQYSKQSDQATAMQQLASVSNKILAMTGTIYGGKASSLFYLLYKVSPEFRELYKYTDCDLFVQHHGLFDKIYKTEEYTSKYGYRKAAKAVKEIPGMSPNMIPLLLPFTLFVKLKDLQLTLPPYSEKVVMIDHLPTVRNAANALANEIYPYLREYPQLLGSYLMACLGYPDCPEQGEQIEVKDPDGNVLLTFTAPKLEYDVLPKDQYVLDLVKSENALGRKVLIYFSQTHKRDARPRVKRLLEAHGFKVSVLHSTVDPSKREEWLAKEVAAGFDVLMTNGKLVETGLDLIFGHTIVEFGTEYSISTLWQSIRRSWRLGQDKEIKVIFLMYKDTMQSVAGNLIARKMRAAEMLVGDDIEGLAQTDESGTDFFVELAQAAFKELSLNKKAA